MKRKNALSVLGYIIILVIILGFMMIASAPVLVGKYSTQYQENHKENNRVNNQIPNRQEQIKKQLSYDTNREYMREIEHLRSRIDTLEDNVSDRYICKIEGYTDADGNELSLSQRDYAQKFIFVCEYKNR